MVPMLLIAQSLSGYMSITQQFDTQYDWFGYYNTFIEGVDGA